MYKHKKNNINTYISDAFQASTHERSQGTRGHVFITTIPYTILQTLWQDCVGNCAYPAAALIKLISIGVLCYTLSSCQLLKMARGIGSLLTLHLIMIKFYHIEKNKMNS